MSEDEFIKFDELAKLQYRPRSVVVKDALNELIRSRDELKQQEFLCIKARLAPTVKAQCVLLDETLLLMSTVASRSRINQ